MIRTKPKLQPNNMVHNTINIIISIMFLLNSKGVCNEIEPKISLAFVIDKTKSMAPVIEQVRSNASAIFDTATSSPESPIENFILVLFGDPNVEDPLVTKDSDVFKRKLQLKSLEDGLDCPELAMTGIKKALDVSLRGSLIYVFTDAPARDYKKLDEVKHMAQEKECQVVFILIMSQCFRQREYAVNSLAYSELTEATTGQLFYLDDEKETSEILKYVQQSITSRRVTLSSNKYSRGDLSLDIERDPRMKDLMVAVTTTVGHNLRKPQILRPDEDTINDEGVKFSMRNIFIQEVTESEPGLYKLEYNCNGDSYVVVTARSDVRFRHGFFPSIVSSIDDTVFNPVSGTKNYLFIKLFGENVQLNAVILVDVTYKALLELPLKLQDDKQNLYHTDPFDLPSSKFRVSVKGVDTDKKSEITRYGNLVLEAESRAQKKPFIAINGSSSIKLVIVEHDGDLRLNCTVEAEPEPKIFAWRHFKGRNIPSELVRSPPNYYRMLDLKNLISNSTYECYAENSLGSDDKTVQIEVTPEYIFRIKEKPKSQTLNYGAKAVLKCGVESYPPAKISWILMKNKVVLLKRGDILLSPDNSTLTIKHLEPRSRGRYGCIIEHPGVKISSSPYFYYATITLSAKKPIFERPSTEIFSKEGVNNELTCRLLAGKPQPELKWYRKFELNPTARFMELKEAENHTTKTINQTTRYDAGVYKCIAINEVGWDMRVIHLYVERELTVKLNISGTILAKIDSVVNIKCTVDGAPKPEVVWLKDETPIAIKASSNVEVFRNHILRVRVRLRDSGTYTCKAENKLRAVRESVNITVYFLDVTSPMKTTVKPKCGQTRHLVCKDFIHGYPEPTLKWIFASYDKTVAPVMLSQTNPKGGITIKKKYLIITKIQLNQRGKYICEANNIGGTVRVISYDVDVQCPLKIQISKTPYKAVVGDRSLKIFCNATGNPEPTFTWNHKGIQSDTGIKNWLIIENVTTNSGGLYFCNAKTKASSKSGRISVSVAKYPPQNSIKCTTNQMVARGSRELISCSIPHGPDDTVTWFRFQNKQWKFINNEMVIDGDKLILSNATEEDSGVYTCRVNKITSPVKESANINVNVVNKVFLTEAPKKVEKYEKEIGYLDCRVIGKAKTVAWWHNGTKLKYTTEIYHFRMNTLSVGEFKCKVTNEFGTAFKTFNLVLKEFTDCVLQIDEYAKNQPLMITTSRTWPAFETSDGLTTIPKLQDVVFSCPTHFTKFKAIDITATCYGGTIFFVEGNVLDYGFIKCNEDLRPNYIELKHAGKKIPCLDNTTISAKLIFGEDPNAIDAIEYCLDSENNPIYAKSGTRFPADNVPKNTTMWDAMNLDRYNCDYQQKRFKKFSFDTSECCFGKRFLVNPRDVFPGPLQRATYNRLNIVPHWSTCNSENWDEIEASVRRLTSYIDNELIIYTGTAGKLSLNYNGGKSIVALKRHQDIVATHIWKVVQYPPTRSSIAIVQLNIPEVQLSEVNLYIRCTDVCDKIPWLSKVNWRDVTKGFTYCCELKDFIDKFGFEGIPFQPYFDLLVAL